VHVPETAARIVCKPASVGRSGGAADEDVKNTMSAAAAGGGGGVIPV